MSDAFRQPGADGGLAGATPRTGRQSWRGGLRLTRASRSLRLVAGLFVVLVLAVGAVAILHGGSGPGRTAVTRASWVSYHDQAGWSAPYPAGFHMEVSEQERGLSIVEVTLANFAAQPGVQVRVSRYSDHVCAIPPLDRFGRFPADGVAFRLLTDDAPPPDPLHRYMTRLPLSLASFRPSIPGRYSDHLQRRDQRDPARWAVSRRAAIIDLPDLHRRRGLHGDRLDRTPCRA